MTRDPVEQAHIDFAAGGPGASGASPEEWAAGVESWADADFRAYNRELRALQPAEAPPPWPVTLAFLAGDAALAEAGSYVERGWRERPALLATVPLLALAVWVSTEGRSSAGRTAALSRGVVRAGEGPPDLPRAPRTMIAAGSIAAVLWMRRRRGVRYPRGRGVATLAPAVAREIEERMRWRRWSRVRSGGGPAP